MRRKLYRPSAFQWLGEMRSFLLLWSSQAVSSLGSAMTSYALVIWVYRQQGTATSVALLSFFTYLPSILFCFIAGTLADGWNKKRVMLVCDLMAALGAAVVWALYGAGGLRVWHLYAVNLLISFMNAFQNPAAYVAVSLLTPKAHYARASGLQAFSGALVSVLTPALAATVLAFGGLTTVLTLDLASFAAAFFVLLFCVRLPGMEGREGGETNKNAEGSVKESFGKSCAAGLRFLREHTALLKIILFFALINLLAYMTGFGILPAMVLARTGGNQAALGAVSSAMGLGTLAGSVLATLTNPSKRKTRVIFAGCGLSFLLCDLLWGLGRQPWIWVCGAFAGSLPLPFLNVNLSTIMRTRVPLPMQGRVFATRDTLQYCTIPLGLFLGGFLADNLLEPLMAAASPLSDALAVLVGRGHGSGMAVLFLITGITGASVNAWALRHPAFRTLDGDAESASREAPINSIPVE